MKDLEELQGAKAIIKAVFETPAEMARSLKIPARTVYEWNKNDNVPLVRRRFVIAACKRRGYVVSFEQLRGVK